MARRCMTYMYKDESDNNKATALLRLWGHAVGLRLESAKCPSTLAPGGDARPDYHIQPFAVVLPNMNTSPSFQRIHAFDVGEKLQIFPWAISHIPRVPTYEANLWLDSADPHWSESRAGTARRFRQW